MRQKMSERSEGGESEKCDWRERVERIDRSERSEMSEIPEVPATSRSKGRFLLKYSVQVPFEPAAPSRSAPD